MKTINTYLTALVLGITATSFSATFNVSTEQELLQALATASNNGEDDVINLSAGTFSIKNVGSSNFKYEAKSGENFSLTITGAGMDKTIIDGKNATGSLLYISSTGSGSITIKNLTLKGGETTFTDIDGTFNFTGGGLYSSVEGDVLIENVKFTQNSAGMGSAGGAYVRSGKGNITIRNCMFYRNVSKTGAGIYIAIGDYWGNLSSASLNLYNNIFYQNGGYQGVGFYISPNTTGQINIINNTVMGNIIFNNSSPDTSYGVGGYLSLNGRSGKVNVYNNIFWQNKNDARASAKVNDLFFDNIQSSPELSLFNNIINPNDTNSFAVRYTATINLGKNIYTDPQLNDPNKLNFLPKKGSPVIDKGESSVVSFNTDFGGNSRKVDGDGDGSAAVDIGALEYAENASASDPTLSTSGGGGGGCNLGKNNTSDITFLFMVVLISLYKLTVGGRKNEVE